MIGLTRQSLFEDNAQFGLGMRVSADKLYGYAMELVDKVLAEEKAPAAMKLVCEKIKTIDQYDEKGAGVEEMRMAVKDLKALIGTECTCPTGKALKAVADNLVRKSVWVLGGDGWAYDIGATACAPFGSPSASCPSKQSFFGAFRRA